MRVRGSLTCGLVALALGMMTAPFASAQAQSGAHGAADVASEARTIPVGTVITVQNWNQYKEFMPDGMAGLFAGEYALKMPSAVQIEIGPTVINPPPPSYMAATEEYASQVKLVRLPDGGLTIQNYHGGRPFPNPEEPNKGWKILANLWYRYLPKLTVDTRGSACLVAAGGAVNCKSAILVERQLAYLTDPGTPSSIAAAGDKFYTQWLMVTEPEQERYTATLTISYDDLTREEDSYVFLPALRRYQPISTRARCSPNQGTDSTLEDYRAGFDSNLTQLKVDYLGVRPMIALLPTSMPSGQFPADFEMPLGWPKPSWGKWQVRNVDMISASKLPKYAQGYCYGKRVMYVDQVTAAPLWEDLYDKEMKMWRLYGLFLHPRPLPNLGVVETNGTMVYAYWDVQHSHATFFVNPANGAPFYIDGEAPKDYLDLARYTEPSGLNLIMR